MRTHLRFSLTPGTREMGITWCGLPAVGDTTYEVDELLGLPANRLAYCGNCIRAWEAYADGRDTARATDVWIEECGR